ncbi:LacI family transcriptional regulator [Brenneria roseae subsp. americana]|uniref:LacI family transcriptional regulator n=1 Tax=Brenneria roseae subsp. americana TaxID=1508507 RepID=A0A2U1TIM4_9GAMM|nr:LacI family DNA-binding transcriptional regulator [Brenneria roseae]PWC09264.1 LacI family transcriptional regulator [Brenneria roseae subsp. americana]
MAKTVEQIANALNLSITTVRLVLNDKAEQYRISEKTQTRINHYVAEHGYVVNHTARSLKLNKTDTLGLIVPRLSNLFFSTLAEKLEMRCREAGYQLMISCTYSDERYENKLVESLLQRNIDGLFVVPSTQQTQNHHLKLIKRPLVFLDRDFGDCDAPLVMSDNFQGAVQLTEAMLANRDPTSLFFMAGDIQQPAIKERLRGYQQVMVQQGLFRESQDWILEASHNRREDGAQMMREFFTRHTDAPHAFIASSLPVLEGVLSVLRERYGHIPAEMNIGTFDEHAMLGFLSNNIWSMRQNEDAWVEQAFSAMRHALQGESGASKAIIPMKMIHRHRASTLNTET